MAESQPHNAHQDGDDGIYVPPSREVSPAGPPAPVPEAPPGAPGTQWDAPPPSIGSAPAETEIDAEDEPEIDIYGQPVPGHYRSAARYADVDAAVEDEHFAPGLRRWSFTASPWAPDQTWPAQQVPLDGPP